MITNKLVKTKVDKHAKICNLYFQMIAAVSHCLAAKPRGGRREKRHGQVGRWIIMFKTLKS